MVGYFETFARGSTTPEFGGEADISDAKIRYTSLKVLRLH